MERGSDGEDRITKAGRVFQGTVKKLVGKQ